MHAASALNSEVQEYANSTAFSMREFALNMHTNVWNSVRFVLFTIVLLPIAEILWAKSHSARCGARVLNGKAVRLRRSRLAYWGLHQEVDDRSRLSRIIAISLFIINIGGTLLLEYGSGSKEDTLLQTTTLSPAFETGLAASAKGSMAFLDAGLLLGNRLNVKRCIDGKPRNVSHFGFTFTSVKHLKIAHVKDVDISTNGKSLISRMFVSNSGFYIFVWGDANSRVYLFNNKKPDFQNFVLYANDTTTCWEDSLPLLACKDNGGKVNPKESFSHALAIVSFSELYRKTTIIQYWKKESVLRINLNNVKAYAHDVKVDTKGTEWVKKGLPTYPNLSGINKNGLREIEPFPDPVFQNQCGHAQAVPLVYLNGLSTSRREKFSSPTVIYKQMKGRNLVWVFGNKILLGSISQTRKEICVAMERKWVCVSARSKSLHKLIYYDVEAVNKSYAALEKKGSFFVHGTIANRDIADLAAQSLLESWRAKRVANLKSKREVLNSVANFVEEGGIVLNGLRLCGRGTPGKSVTYYADMATINVVGIIGAVSLLLLLPMPCISLWLRGSKLEIDVENSFRRAVMAQQGTGNCVSVPEEPPNIVMEEVVPGKVYNLAHSYLSEEGNNISRSARLREATFADREQLTLSRRGSYPFVEDDLEISKH